MTITLFIDWLLMPQAPAATIFVLLLCVLLTFLTSLTNRLFTNPEQLRAWRKEIKDWTDAFKEAQRSKDKKKLAKVEKQKARIMKLQQKMSWQSMKVSLLFFIPFIIMWQVLWGIYREPVAFLPGFGPLSIVLWYLLCSLFFSTLFSRAFRVGMGAME
ncbi:MAG: EMC3/TMCO1 family protein [Candidatus Bathyarchaeia archaeon]